MDALHEGAPQQSRDYKRLRFRDDFSGIPYVNRRPVEGAGSLQSGNTCHPEVRRGVRADLGVTASDVAIVLPAEDFAVVLPNPKLD
jgi:hypothetical protein